MSILYESQDQYQPKIPRLDVSSMRYADNVHDVVHSSQYFQDFCALCLWPLSLGSTGKKNTDCLLLEFLPPSISSLLMIE